ncbi:MAG: hypothetical protein FWC01_00340 [Treponema sp.]|nr:hypothetical protein [Treponema sp.]MCL2236710.1 hypothetical protein [Treponema sp.]
MSNGKNELGNIAEIPSDVPAEVLSDAALLFLYYRIEHILGIKSGYEALRNLNNYLEETCKSSFVENPAAYEYLLTSREQIFEISNFLTVNETYFFRESSQFELLAQLLPELSKLGRPVQICSAAVSTGCEAYSIAMLLDYYARNGLDFDFAVDAFDVNSNAIEIAKNARYTSNTLRADGSSFRHIMDSYLIFEGNEHIVTQNIRRKVRFFPHNIMRGLDKQYDIIFFRNSLIYFSSKNRLSVINNLAESLMPSGLLFLGASETSSVKHPLLANRFSRDVFYFQKINPSDSQENIILKSPVAHKKKNSLLLPLNAERHHRKLLPKHNEITVKCEEICEILKTDEGKPNSVEVLNSLGTRDLSQFSGGRICACAIHLLNIRDFNNASKIIEYLEKNNSGAFTRFLRGEILFLLGNAEDAESSYHEAAIKDKYFWPAYYRIAILSSEGNQTRFEYKVKKTIESIELCQSLEPESKLNYECFLGGFSPDYFRRILEKKLV